MSSLVGSVVCLRTQFWLAYDLKRFAAVPRQRLADRWSSPGGRINSLDGLANTTLYKQADLKGSDTERRDEFDHSVALSAYRSCCRRLGYRLPPTIMSSALDCTALSGVGAPLSNTMACR
jgi:hypothetical protein